jgi:hypothetical protein
MVDFLSGDGLIKKSPGLVTEARGGFLEQG